MKKVPKFPKSLSNLRQYQCRPLGGSVPFVFLPPQPRLYSCDFIMGFLIIVFHIFGVICNALKN